MDTVLRHGAHRRGGERRVAARSPRRAAAFAAGRSEDPPPGVGAARSGLAGSGRGRDCGGGPTLRAASGRRPGRGRHRPAGPAVAGLGAAPRCQHAGHAGGFADRPALGRWRGAAQPRAEAAPGRRCRRAHRSLAPRADPGGLPQPGSAARRTGRDRRCGAGPLRARSFGAGRSRGVAGRCPARAPERHRRAGRPPRLSARAGWVARGRVRSPAGSGTPQAARRPAHRTGRGAGAACGAGLAGRGWRLAGLLARSGAAGLGGRGGRRPARASRRPPCGRCRLAGGRQPLGRGAGMGGQRGRPIQRTACRWRASAAAGRLHAQAAALPDGDGARAADRRVPPRRRASRSSRAGRALRPAQLRPAICGVGQPALGARLVAQRPRGAHARAGGARRLRRSPAAARVLGRLARGRALRLFACAGQRGGPPRAAGQCLPHDRQWRTRLAAALDAAARRRRGAGGAA